MGVLGRVPLLLLLLLLVLGLLVCLVWLLVCLVWLLVCLVLQLREATTLIALLGSEHSQQLQHGVVVSTEGLPATKAAQAAIVAIVAIVDVNTTPTSILHHPFLSDNNPTISSFFVIRSLPVPEDLPRINLFL